MRLELKSGAVRVGPEPDPQGSDAPGSTVHALEGSCGSRGKPAEDIVLQAGGSYRLRHAVSRSSTRSARCRSLVRLKGQPWPDRLFENTEIHAAARRATGGGNGRFIARAFTCFSTAAGRAWYRYASPTKLWRVPGVAAWRVAALHRARFRVAYPPQGK